jgi:hypothetical protein
MIATVAGPPKNVNAYPYALTRLSIGVGIPRRVLHHVIALFKKAGDTLANDAVDDADLSVGHIRRFGYSMKNCPAHPRVMMVQVAING